MSRPNLLLSAALLALTGAFGCAARQGDAGRLDAIERNKTIVQGELDALDELLAENYVTRRSGGSIPDRAA